MVDRGGRLADEFIPTVLRARAGEPRQWLLDGWEALSNVAKYLRRGSLLDRTRHRPTDRRAWRTGAVEGVSELDGLPVGGTEVSAQAAPRGR